MNDFQDAIQFGLSFNFLPTNQFMIFTKWEIKDREEEIKYLQKKAMYYYSMARTM